MANTIQGDASASNEVQGIDEPHSPPFTAEQNAAMNKALTAYSKNLQKSVQKDIAAGIQAALSGLVAPQQPTEDAPSAERPTVKKVDSKAAELEKQLQILMKRDEEREMKLRQAELDKALDDTLLAIGVSPDLLKPAKAYVKSERLKTDEEGSPKFRHDEIDYDLKDGLKLWSKSDDAKWCLSPKSAKGAGVRGSIKAPSLSVNPNLSIEDKAAATKQAILAKYGR